MTSPADAATVENSLFEGLFRAIPVTPTMAPELMAAGYDPDNPVKRYPAAVWRGVIEVVRRHTFPDLDPDAGTRAVGRRLVDGFFETLIGKFLAVSLPMMVGKNAFRRIPSLFKMVRKDLIVTAVEENAFRFRLMIQDPVPLPQFLAGFLEGVGHHSRRPTTITVESQRPDGYVLLVVNLPPRD